MTKSQINEFATLRATVGYLGEREQANWWPSTFFGQSSSAFLAPLFARTTVLAQCTSVTRAAAVVHDERIGVGNVYHLFRLPEDIEQRVHSALHDPELTQAVQNTVRSKESAKDWLRGRSAASTAKGEGPLVVGDLASLRTQDALSKLAALYFRAFEGGEAVFPYFADRG